MPVFMFGGEKGGCGKSTLATNLAVCMAHQKLDTVLVDTDPQNTSSKWITRRNNQIENGFDIPLVHCIQRTGNVHKAILDLEGRYDCVIIDAGGNDNEAQRTAMTAADMLFVPIRASQADLETLPYVCQLIDMAKNFNPELVVFSLISMAPTDRKSVV